MQQIAKPFLLALSATDKHWGIPLFLNCCWETQPVQQLLRTARARQNYQHRLCCKQQEPGSTGSIACVANSKSQEALPALLMLQTARARQHCHHRMCCKQQEPGSLASIAVLRSEQWQSRAPSLRGFNAAVSARIATVRKLLWLMKRCLSRSHRTITPA